MMSSQTPLHISTEEQNDNKFMQDAFKKWGYHDHQKLFFINER